MIQIHHSIIKFGQRGVDVYKVDTNVVHATWQSLNASEYTAVDKLEKCFFSLYPALALLEEEISLWGIVLHWVLPVAGDKAIECEMGRLLPYI